MDNRTFRFFALSAALCGMLLGGCSDDDNGGGEPNPPGGGTAVPAYEWDQIASNAQLVLETQFWRGEPDNYYWVDNTHQTATFYHYWQTAHAMETLMDAYERTGDSFYRERVRVVLARIEQSNPGYINEYYDDMAWMGMACLRAYGLFGEAEYLRAAEILLEDVKGGWLGSDEGMLWCKIPSEAEKRNACTHWTVSCFASKIYSETGRYADLEFANAVYQYALAHLYDSSTGATFDGLDATNVYLTYNQGVLIGSALMLYRHTGSNDYYNVALKCADYCINNDRFASGGIWRNEGAGNDGALNQNNRIFKGILAHYMTEFLHEEKVPENRRMAYIRFIENMAVTLYKATADTFLYGGGWDAAPEPGERIWLGCQLSGVILMETVAVYADRYPDLLAYVKTAE